MAATIGGMQVIHTETILLPHDQEAWIEFKAINWDVKLKLVLKKNSDENISTTTVEAIDDYGLFTLTNFEGIGVSFPSMKMGETEDRSLFVSGFGTSAGGVTHITLQFTIEGEN
ncbi:hypothetical protein [Vibrio splendidus]|uniref:hypothetical protein n=1 Tax=Vibrio splendidus TaxID=29497 RepID=UPI000769FF52|nr:hypothetical protein [Vibrio splendidus]PHX06117.1 hypothetical protein VSPL_25780 [Vibrio splendidus]